MEKIWLKHYPKDVPFTININQYENLADLLERSCHKFSSKPAYRNMGTRITYKELDKKTRDFASFLQQQLKLKKGDRVAIMMPNILQYPICLFGILRAGLIAVNTNPLYTKKELVHQLNDAGVNTLIVLENFAHTVEEALPELKTVKNIIISQLGDCFPFFKRHVVNFVVRYLKRMVPKYSLANTITFLNALALGQTLDFKPVQIDHRDIAFLQYTGGTTGRAKGTILTHRNMVANVEQAYNWIKSEFEEGKEIIVTALPLYHIFSLTANCLTFLKEGALNILITNPRDLKRFINEIKDSRFTAITGVNTLYNALINHPDFAKKVDFSGLKYALSGGMSLQQKVANTWKKITGTPILEAYGLTETSPAVTINPSYLEEFNGSSGLPISSTEVSIRDDNGKELPLGEKGELWVKGPQVMQAYWNAPEETAEVLTEDGWLKTGDIAKMDEKGFVYLVDRKKDMIIVSGFNVYPNEVEAALSQHPDILEVGVIGLPNENSGETVKASIVKKNNGLSKEDVVKHAKKHLTNYKIPKIIEFVDELPKTTVGKVLRRKIKEDNKS